MILLILLANPFKINRNSFQDWARFTLAKVIINPFDRITVSFTAIARKAGRQDVFRCISGIIYTIISNRYPVIYRYLHTLKYPLLLSAVSTAIVPIFQASQPIFCREASRQIAFSSSTAVISLFLKSRICYVPRTFNSAIFLRINQTLLFISLRLFYSFSAYFIRMVLLIFLLRNFDLFRICLTILACAHQNCLFMLRYITPHTFPIYFRMRLLVTAIFISDTCAARLSKPPCLRPIKKGFCWKIFIAAFTAALKGVWIVDHSAPRYAGSHVVCGQDGTSAAFSRSYSLDHTLHYTAQRQGGQLAA